MTKQFKLRRKQVLRLKATAGDGGHPLTFDQVAAKMGLKTANSALYYVQGLDGVCPCCYRRLEK